MSRARDDKTISLKLSEVLSDIGVNERIVKIRRKCALLAESMRALNNTVWNTDVILYYFGSQSEGATTTGLRSDLDAVFCLRNIHVSQDLAEWKPGVRNVLMVQDERTSPGYCLLQLLRHDLPEAATYVPDEDVYLEDDNGKILHKNTLKSFVHAAAGMQQNGPAATLEGESGCHDKDHVIAYHCDSWPKEAREWIDRQCVGNWPSVDIKRLSISKGCFVVPVGSQLNNLHEVEWRMSTSMAERLMMFNLNITQLRCYVMLKLINKTFFTMNGKGVITSFMCKCTLFHCIENRPAYYWRKDNLYSCVMTCISTLHDRVLRLNCPHYIIPGNNLMAQRINPEQQRHLLNVLDRLINFKIDMFFAIEIDDLGKRIQMKLTDMVALHSNLPSQNDIELDIVLVQLFKAFYSAGKFDNAELTLRELEHEYTDSVVPACCCYPTEIVTISYEWASQVCRNNDLLNKRIAYCVIFLRCEASIIPQELRHELFRSTEEEIHNRSFFNTGWMDLAVIDSLPYMYFLQYKVYKHLGRHQAQQQALSNLLNTTLNTPNLAHRETAWNVLGKCMEQENMPADALWCYERSLEVRPHNNAANFHKARLQRV